MATPETRCRTQVHIPSRPRYSVPRRCILCASPLWLGTGPAPTLPPGNRPLVQANRLLNGGFGWRSVWSYGVAPTMSSEAAERLVAGRWMLETALRRGPSGVIWRAAEAAGGRRLAVEQLHLPAPPDPADPGQSALWDRVAGETRTPASLAHPALA